MADALDPGKIAEIRRLVADGLGRNEVARRVGCAISTVTRYSPPGSFDRAATAAAVKARQIDMAARRAEQQRRYLDIVDELQERLVEEYEHAQPAGADGDVRRWKTKRPPARESADLMRAASAATAADLRLADYKDRGSGADEAREIVLQFGIAVRAADLGDDTT